MFLFALHSCVIFMQICEQFGENQKVHLVNLVIFFFFFEKTWKVMEFLLLKKRTNPVGVQAIFVYGCWRLKISPPTTV